VGQTSKKIRKIHRYLGLFIGIQFLFWTVSGIYFSWTDLDNIHGDQFKNLAYQPQAFDDLISPSDLQITGGIRSLEIRDINNLPYYWVNETQLYNARNGQSKNEVSKMEALSIAENYMKSELEIKSVELIRETGPHHEYRERLLPAYVISYVGKEDLKAYVSSVDGKFQTVRHRNWRWFDFLWMTHTMDYQGRDNFNTLLLRAFSFLGLITVLSGFLLWYISSPTLRKLRKRKKPRE
jgi:uncharacterized iron-regulated membrane protein